MAAMYTYPHKGKAHTKLTLSTITSASISQQTVKQRSSWCHCTATQADQRHAAPPGVAIQTANRLPNMVPTPSSDPLTELDAASWQAHTFSMPLQVWHQLSAGSYLPKPLHKAAPPSWPPAASKDSGVEVRRDVDQVGKQVPSWSSLQQLGSKVAGCLPGLVPLGLESSVEDQKRSQVGISIIAAFGCSYIWVLFLLLECVAPVHDWCITVRQILARYKGLSACSEAVIAFRLHTVCLVCRNPKCKASLNGKGEVRAASGYVWRRLL